MKLYFGLPLDQYHDNFYSEFTVFFNNLLIDEGGYVPGKQARAIKDPGGATKFGISLSFLKSCSVDLADINHDGIIDEKDIVLLTQAQAAELYFKYFWNPLYPKITNIQLANRLFNLGVNTGKPRAVMLLQQAVNDSLQAPTLKRDGIFGAGTLGAVNGIAFPQKLYDRYIVLIEDYYRALNKPQFLAGWIKRTLRLLPQSWIDKIKS